MNTASAQLNNYRQSPRKVRLVAGLIRGKTIPQAVNALQFAGKHAAAPLKKLIQSAEANAKAQGMNVDTLIVKKITVDAGAILYRTLPMSKGRAFRMRKRVSKVFVELGESVKPAKTKKAKAKAKADTEAEVKKS